jgi:hypothetical protein
VGELIEKVIAPEGMSQGVRRGAERVEDREDAAHESVFSMPDTRRGRAVVCPHTTTAPAVAGAVVLSLNRFSPRSIPRQPRGIHIRIIPAGLGIHDWWRQHVTRLVGEVKCPVPLPPTLQTAEASRTVMSLSLGDAVKAYEADLIKDALKSARGSRAKAARLLRTTDRILNYRLRKLEIDWKRYQD